MTIGLRSRAILSGAGLLVLALVTARLAAFPLGVARAAADSALAVPTSAAYLPVIYMPPPPTPTGTPPPVTPPASGDWHAVLAYYRASARLPNVGENSVWSAGAANHASYMIRNHVLAYIEDPATPGYSPQGATEAANSNLMLSDNMSTSDRQALDFWMAKPFHALGVLDPALLTTGFGSFREDDGPPYRMAAVMDVRQGLGAIPGSVRFPIKWPEQNSTVYLTSYDGNEQPDPLTSCPGYIPPSGLPIILQVGPGGTTIDISAHSFRQGTTDLPYCIFGPASYTNPMADQQDLGRLILADSDAFVLIPQQPLVPGLSYTVSITANGKVITWTFYVSA